MQQTVQTSRNSRARGAQIMSLVSLLTPKSDTHSQDSPSAESPTLSPDSKKGPTKFELLRSRVKNSIRLQEASPESEAECAEAQLFEQHFTVLEKLGEGCNSVVRRCLRRKNQKVFAVKSIRCRDEEEVQKNKEAFRLAQGLDHPSVLKVHQLYVCPNENTCNVVMDYIPLPTLQEKPLPPGDESEVRRAATLLLEVLEFLHRKGVCHRDLKPTNVLNDSARRNLVLIDFGISKRFRGRVMMTADGTLPYQAPQLLKGEEYSERVDIWALGVMLFQMFTESLPFSKEYVADLKHQIITEDVEYPSSMSQELKAFLSLLLSKDPEKRPAADSLLRHPFLMKGEASHRQQAERAHSGEGKSRNEASEKTGGSDERVDIEMFCRELNEKHDQKRGIVNLKRVSRRRSCQNCGPEFNLD